MSNSTQTVGAQVRQPGKDEPKPHGFGKAPMKVPFAAAPWRMFRWHLGQPHYSGI
jgi:hypothetical protein